MANVSRDTANWRLFGGGGLILAGLLWTILLVLAQTGAVTLPSWVGGIVLVVLAIALVLVAFGQTGSNGAVGNDKLGKLALVVYAIGWVLLAIVTFAPAGGVLASIAAVLLIIGGLVSAFAIFRKGVAKGAAAWVLFVPAIVGVVYAIGLLGVTAISGMWFVPLVLAVLFAITGVLYLLNDRKIG